MNVRKQFNAALWVTISRFFLVPVFIYFFLLENFQYAFIALVIASFTDVLDGFLARRLNMGTTLGSILDPLADKFLMMVSFIALSVKGAIPWWCTAIVISRDIYIVFGLLYIYYIRRINILIIKPSILSKRTTFTQFLLLTFSFLEFFLIKNTFNLADIYSKLIINIQNALVYITVILTVITFLHYTQMGVNMLRFGEKKKI
jgi:cardiolipin synthase (CMP-forming)